MPLSAQETLDLFSKIFIQEFTREFLFLSDVVAGRATRKGEFTDKLLEVIDKIPLPDGTFSQVVSVASKLTSFAHEHMASARIEHIGGLTDVVDPQALRIVLEQVARDAYFRHEFFIQTRLTEDPENGLIPFAKCAVERTLEYLASNRLPISRENVLAGLIEGRSGAFVSGWFNTKLPSREAYKNLKFSC